MGVRTPNQEKALRWFCEQNGLIPQLSAHPVYRFLNKQGEVEEHNIIHIHANWERWRKEGKKEKALS